MPLLAEQAVHKTRRRARLVKNRQLGQILAGADGYLGNVGQGRDGMRALRGVIVATLLFGSGQVAHAEDTVLFPDVHGKMVRIPIAHSYEQCRKNGRHLEYPDSDSHAWCTQHCNGKICQ
jgi:hypothetical protein